ncbi:MAG: cell division protein FtsX [Alphaproteobacteria bacterium]
MAGMVNMNFKIIHANIIRVFGLEKKARPDKAAKRRKQPLDLPFEQDNHRVILGMMVGLLVMLGVLALASALSLQHVSHNWRTGLAQAVSIELPPLLTLEAPIAPDQFDASNNQNTAQDGRIARAIAIALDQPRIEAARLLGAQEIRDLIRPWLGSNIDASRLPIPKIIKLQINPVDPPDFQALRRILQSEIAGARLNDYASWRSNLLGYIGALSFVSYGILLLVAVCIGGLIMFLSLSGLKAHADSITLLHLIGAHDRYIAQQFKRLAVNSSLKASIMGFICGAAILLIYGYFILPSSLVMHKITILPLFGWFILLFVPIGAVLIAGWTAYLTVIKRLSRMV